MSSSFQCLKLWCILIPYPLNVACQFIQVFDLAFCTMSFGVSLPSFSAYIHAAGHLKDLCNRGSHLLPFWEMFLNYCFDNFVPFLLFSYLQFLLIFFFLPLLLVPYFIFTAFYFFLLSSVSFFPSFLLFCFCFGEGEIFSILTSGEKFKHLFLFRSDFVSHKIRREKAKTVLMLLTDL